ncbi:semaphorin-7A-like isoform X2 [Hemicordylus capensis]|nr:semaphorin-7A-like isoform X2 [Hemicordylus capensis]
MFHEPGSEKVFVGGRGVLKILTFTDSKAKTPEQISLRAEDKATQDCKKKAGHMRTDHCDNFIRVIRRLGGSITVCGTNAGSPKCWSLINDTALRKDAQGKAVTISGENISPALPSQGVVSIAIEDNLYSAFSGNKSSIQRSYGSKKKLKTEDKWLARTEFVSAALLKERESASDEIYFFYNDVNQAPGLDEEPFKAQVGRVCKADEGGKPLLVDSWNTFLKARLVCGHPSEPPRFHHLQDAFVLQEGRKRDEAVLYGVFSSTWGTSAVCVYSMNRISNLFKTSNFKGYSGTIPQHRPGTCGVTNPTITQRSMPQLLTLIKDHPEIDRVIYPEGEHPLYVLQNNDTYTQVVVDRIQDAHNKSREVLFLGTAKGKIHKVLRSREKTVIIAELSPFNKEAPVSSMILDTTTGHLYVSTEFEVARLPLVDCDEYKENCWKCVLARDPYCGWDPDGKMCSPVSQNYSGSNLLQSLDSQTTDVCKGAEAKLAQETLKKVSVDSKAFIYLPCPLRSHHAIYTWVKDEKTYPCAMDGQSCTLRFEEKTTPMVPGVFRCTATEEGYKEEITAFKVTLNSGRIPEVSLLVVAMGVLFLSVTILLL